MSKFQLTGAGDSDELYLCCFPITINAVSGIKVDMRAPMKKDTSYHILINLKTGDGYECFGKFFVGENRSFANRLFSRLKGEKEVSEKSILTFELMETRKTLPVNLQIIGCSLADLTENCKLITCEMFKALNMEQI